MTVEQILELIANIEEQAKRVGLVFVVDPAKFAAFRLALRRGQGD